MVVGWWWEGGVLVVGMVVVIEVGIGWVKWCYISFSGVCSR